ncbi:hypothetical protein N9777_09640 [Ascidiaceihabitans sp.]|nr:hypothetical protein [Ascidiaceihabitans sp.]
MTHILQIDSSGRTNASVSRQLSAQIVEKLGGQTTHRDLLATPFLSWTKHGLARIGHLLISSQNNRLKSSLPLTA